MKILLWNTKKNKINKLLGELVEQENADYVALIEYDDDIDELIGILNEKGRKYNKYVTIGADNMVAFGKLTNVKPGPHEKRYSIQVVNDTMIICCIHLSSRLYGDYPDRQLIDAQKIVSEIKNYEKENDMYNTVVIGDFNANPYDKMCLGALGFHAVPIRTVAKKGRRKVEDSYFDMFYNPTWNLLGDFNYPPGTFFHGGSNPVNSFWHLLDQVLLSPTLIDSFNEESLKIVYKVNGKKIINEEGHPDKQISDHLPIMFEIEDI